MPKATSHCTETYCMNSGLSVSTLLIEQGAQGPHYVSKPWCTPVVRLRFQIQSFITFMLCQLSS